MYSTYVQYPHKILKSPHMNDKLSDIKTTAIAIGQPEYPVELMDLEDPPEQLYIRGTFNSSIFASSLAVVGSREMTTYGAALVEKFVTALSSQDIPVISGFMYGVDTKVHHTALKAGGITIAVLAHGLDYLYPRENGELYYKIMENGGCLISEYLNDFKPERWTFPKRNRIVAALAKKGTLVIEAAEQSGSLITAAYADALNRPLYAAPGSVFSKTSKGTNQLIKDHLAQMVIDISDLVPEVLKK